MGRVWRYPYKTWKPPLWQYFLPWVRGGDEYGRRVAVTHVPFVGFIAIAYHMCKCEDCTCVRDDRMREARLYSQRSGTEAGRMLRDTVTQMDDEGVLRFRVQHADSIEDWLVSDEGPGFQYTARDEDDD